MEEKSKPLPDILTQVNKEKFRRFAVISSRIIALLLILGIVWIGFVQIHYVQEVNKIKAQYGNMGYCYLCGQENLRKCECQYASDISQQMGFVNLSQLSKDTATYNIQPCPDRNPRMGLGIGNLSIRTQ